MSQENVEIVRTLYASLNARDWDRFAEVCDPEVELRGTIGGLEEGRLIRGVAGIRRVTEEEDAEVWDENRVEPRKLFDAGERVVVLQREYDRGKSGVELVVDMAAVVDLRDGRVVRVQPYMEAAAALEAVGLSEQDAGARKF